ncbi:1-phosphofructokinase [Deinococcus peraridilitoris DSM 19664]|uniref:1-phosphofructokinase n=2 Tax=Deinococcus TaxID=1298 RepID=K9ZYK0_DEIPD|nr:1-phosphofructokinase [Deinococcus peraridilitoris DSM 19664]
MIHTITLSPTLDLTYLVPDFRTDDTRRAQTVFRGAGGKGINVSRVAARLGCPTVALGFLGGTTGLEVGALLEAERVRTWFVPVAHNTRTNPIIQDPSGAQIRVSAPGPAVEPHDAERLYENLFSLRRPSWLLVSGSKPPGVPADFFARVIRRARQEDIPIVVDADGDELQRGVEAGADLIKPNQYELERLVGRELPSREAVLSAGREVLARGVRAVAVSLGAAGALLIRADGAWQAVPPRVTTQSAVGSGDSMVAGLCAKLGEGLDPASALRYGVACGTATAMTPGTELCQRSDVEQILQNVALTQLD